MGRGAFPLNIFFLTRCRRSVRVAQREVFGGLPLCSQRGKVLSFELAANGFLRLAANWFWV
ncbi:hypothetical protein A6M13_15820 [Caryophanon tenue]|uniref:Uncharacterized protein n=1 Tax=Caryophanon tenue TaxID=33978 RepID=A0A1C0YAK6_9BACL|nr:hypothetical protein A6M13_15820 [Caryophanon tenue]